MSARMMRSAIATVAATCFAFGDGLGAPIVLSQSLAGPTRFEIAEGTRAYYRVHEQIAGVKFLNDAVGMTEVVEGALVVGSDGSIDASQSRLTIDLRTFTSDQARRDGWVRRRSFEVEKFPLAVFVARRIEGSPFTADESMPFPIVSFQLVGDMTVHGVTKEISWDVLATYDVDKGIVEGKALTNFPFSTFDLAMPGHPMLVSVEDDIRLEIDFKADRLLR